MSGNEFLSHRLQSTCQKHSMMPISDILKLCKKEQDLLYPQLHNAYANPQYFTRTLTVGSVPHVKIWRWQNILDVMMKCEIMVNGKKELIINQRF